MFAISWLAPRPQFAFVTPQCEVAAFVDPAPQAQAWVRNHIPDGGPVFATATEMYKHFGCHVGAAPMSGAIDAVVISTETACHASLACEAISYGLHTLLEKPISTDASGDAMVTKACSKRPDVKLLIALSRRFDPSYRSAFMKLIDGDVGDAFLIKSATIDLFDPTGWFVPYSLKSGGIFIDCGIHDIDIARWFLGLSAAGCAGTRAAHPNVRPAKCFAIGYNALHKELLQYGDADTALGTVQLSDGRSFTIQLGRTGIHGHDASMQLFGTAGGLLVNQTPAMDRTQILDAHGVRVLSTPSYYERFEQAFVQEAREFVQLCLDDKPACVSLDDAVQAARIAHGLTMALRSGLPVLFDADGSPIKPDGPIEPNATTAIINTDSPLIPDVMGGKPSA